MGGQKIQLRKPHGGGWFNRELKLIFVFLGLIFSFNFIHYNGVSAYFPPTLSASVNSPAIVVNGNQVINSANKTTEIPLNLLVYTSNKTGYTATLSSETDETALVNNDSTNGAKINSISEASILSSFNTSKVISMVAMFNGMSNLTALDLSNFDTSQVKYMDSMFSLLDKDKLMDKLEKIYVNNDFNTTKLINSYRMFENRKKLRGGNGSYLANPTTADKTWLRVDRPGVQGYFTRKP